MIPRPDNGYDPARILIVDDEHHNRELLKIMLAPEGFVLMSASSGEEALDMVAEQAPDLILLDVMMPGIDGYEVCSRIKDNLATKNIPIIMVSALADRDARMHGLNAGAEEFLTKPVNRAELSVRVRNLSRLKAYGEYYDSYSKQLEGEMVSQTSELAERTSQAAVLTEHAALLEAAELIRKEQMRFKDEFLSHVSHELRSPLTAIKQFTTILAGGLAGELNAEQAEYQRIVLKNVEQLQSMIDDLLEVTRLETGKLTVAPESVCVADALADTLNTLQETARDKGVALSCEVAPELPLAYADPTRLRQVLINLTENAIKFSPTGGAATLRVRRFEEDPQSLLVEVSDTGCGIAPELGDRVFERLYQVSEGVHGSRKGLGLGLHICKELVTQQGGTIWVAPREDPGCTIRFTLPVYSLNRMLAPMLENDRWPNESAGVVVVEMRFPDLPYERESCRDWSREVRRLVQRCVLPDLDVLLPRVTFHPKAEHVLIVAFADEKGATVLANRIREQLDRLPRLPAGRSLTVSRIMLPPCPREDGLSADVILSRMSRRLEELIQTHLTPGAVQ
jgi:signal transduction histidine kinase